MRGGFPRADPATAGVGLRWMNGSASARRAGLRVTLFPALINVRSPRCPTSPAGIRQPTGDGNARAWARCRAGSRPRADSFRPFLLDAAGGQESQELPLIDRPVAALFLVGVENVLRGRQFSTVISTEPLWCGRTDFNEQSHQLTGRMETGHRRTAAQPHACRHYPPFLQFRGSGLPRNAPLPIAVAWKRVWVGAALFALGVVIRLWFDIPYSLTLCTALVPLDYS